MASWIKPLRLLLLGSCALFISACNDNLPTGTFPVSFNSQNITTGNYSYVGTITYNNSPTPIAQMTISGSTLYLSGGEIDFAAWNLANPTSPVPSFTAREFIDTFSPLPNFGYWTYGDLASGAIGIYNNYAYLSGTKGMSIVNLGTPGSDSAVEQNRIPMPSGGVQGTNPQVIFKAIIPNPNSAELFAFNQQNYVSTLNVSNPPYVQLVQAAPYSASGPVCCVNNGALFQNHVALAMTSKLWLFDISGNNLTNFVESTAIQALNVASNGNYLFIQNQPSTDTAENGGLNQGIYAVNSSGQAVAFYPIVPQVFAVYQNVIYSYEGDDTGVKVYQLDASSLP